VSPGGISSAKASTKVEGRAPDEQKSLEKAKENGWTEKSESRRVQRRLGEGRVQAEKTTEGRLIKTSPAAKRSTGAGGDDKSEIAEYAPQEPLAKNDKKELYEQDRNLKSGWKKSAPFWTSITRCKQGWGTSNK